MYVVFAWRCLYTSTRDRVSGQNTYEEANFYQPLSLLVCVIKWVFWPLLTQQTIGESCKMRKSTQLALGSLLSILLKILFSVKLPFTAVTPYSLLKIMCRGTAETSFTMLKSWTSGKQIYQKFRLVIHIYKTFIFYFPSLSQIFGTWPATCDRSFPSKFYQNEFKRA